MMPHALRACALFLSLSLCGHCLADAPVWKVTKDKHHIFLAGTFHLLSPNDHPLPEAFDRAFEGAQSVVFETDVNAEKDPQFAVKAMQVMMAQPGKSLGDVLEPETQKALKAHLAKEQIPETMVMSMSAAGASLTLSLMALQKMGLSPDYGVEKTLHKRAISAAKPRTVEQLESIDDQLNFLRQMGEGREDALIRYTLRDLKQIDTQLPAMKTAWRTGDVKALDRMMIKPMREEMPQVYDVMLKLRNNNWMPLIETMFEDKDTELVMVGFAHLAGPDGLLAQLEEKGYKVSKFKRGQVPAPKYSQK